MVQTISPQDVEERLAEILTRISGQRDEFIIEGDGKPLAAMVSVEKLDQLRRAARLHLLSVLDRDDQEIPQRQADLLANEAKHESRRGG